MSDRDVLSRPAMGFALEAVRCVMANLGYSWGSSHWPELTQIQLLNPEASVSR